MGQKFFNKKLEDLCEHVDALMQDEHVYCCDALYGYLNMAKVSLDFAVLQSKQYRHVAQGV